MRFVFFVIDYVESEVLVLVLVLGPLVLTLVTGTCEKVLVAKTVIFCCK